MSTFMVLVLARQDYADPVDVIGSLLTPYGAAAEAPSAKMTAWQIGGLDGGAFFDLVNRVHPFGGSPVAVPAPAVIDEPHEQLEQNIVAVDDLPAVESWDAETRFSAIVTPEGDWHDLGNLTPPVRLTYLRELLMQHRDCWAIAVMCHS